jgi:hypothetical protein
MAQRVTYSIVDQPDGRFDLIVRLGSGSLFTRTGFMTLAEAEEEVAFLKVLMTACSTPLARVEDSSMPHLPLRS